MKLYPFSVKKSAHDIEFYRNRLFCEIHDAECGDIKVDIDGLKKLDKHYEEVTEILKAVLDSKDGKVVYLTGPQIGLAKKISVWANEERISKFVVNGKVRI